MNNFNNQTNQNSSNNAFNNNNNMSNKNDNNLNNLLSNFNFPNSNTTTTSMTPFIPSFPGNNNNNNNNNNNSTAMTQFNPSFQGNNNNNNNSTAMTQFNPSFQGNNNNNNTAMTQFSSSFQNNNNNNNNNFGFNFNSQQNNNDMFNQNNLSLFSSQFNGNNQFGFGQFGANMMQFASEPEIFMELKEKVAFYYNFTTGNKIVNAMSHGYLGLSTESDTIKNKDFSILFKTEKFKDAQYIQKAFDQKIKKIDELNYGIHFDSLQKNEQLLNYIINPNILAQNRIMEPLIGGGQNVLRYKFMYNNNVNKEVLKIEVNILYKSPIQNGNMIKSDGSITTNQNDQICVVYNNKVNEGGIEFPPNMNVFAIVGKISISVFLKEDVPSEIDVEIKDNFQRVLKAKKSSKISYEFS
jgi:hypothetical protein